LESHTTYISPPNDDEGWCKPPHQRNSNFHGLPEGNLIAHPTALGQQHMAQEIARKVR
jgi:putative secreted protein